MNDHEWIGLALSLIRHDLMRPFSGKDFYFSTDGVRMHIVEMNDDLSRHTKDRGKDIEAVIKRFQEAELQAEFYINPQHLIDALKGFEDKVCIKLKRDGTLGFETMVEIDSDYTDRKALVMGLGKEDKDE